MYIEMGKAKQNKLTYCYDETVTHETAFFADASFTYDLSHQQNASVLTQLEEEFELLPPNGRFSAYATLEGSSGSIAKPIFSICKPGRTKAEQKSFGAPGGNPTKLAAKFEEAKALYQQKTKRLHADLGNPEFSAGESPILENIRSISKSRHFEAESRRLVVLSDGLQNAADSFQFCVTKGHLPPFDIFKTLPNYALVEPYSLSGVDVSMMLVEGGELPTSQLPYCTSKELREFYPDFFKGNNAASVDLVRLRFGVEG